MTNKTIENIAYGVKNWAIDTSAKVVCYAPVMAAMEGYNGLNSEQIIKSRLSAALTDAVVARVYTKTADYAEDKTRKLTPGLSRAYIKLNNCLAGDKLNFNEKKKIYSNIENIRNYSTDTCSMIGVYTPVYAGILYYAGADLNQMVSSLTAGAIIAAATSRPFRKYALKPWRKVCKYKK